MNLLKSILPSSCEIILHGDTHEGNAMQHRKGILKIIDYISSGKNRYWIHMGDWIDAIMIDDKRYSIKENAQKTILKQMHEISDLYKPIASRGICGLTGNHEFKLEKFGDLSEEICKEIGIPYGDYTCKLSLHDKKVYMMKFFLTHGFRGAITSNAKDFQQQQANMKASIKNKLEHKAADCILMAMGHTHLLMIVPPAERLILSDNGSHLQQKYLGIGNHTDEYIEPERRYYVNTGSFLKLYEVNTSSYAERAGYNPSEIGCIKVVIEDRKISCVERILI